MERTLDRERCINFSFKENCSFIQTVDTNCYYIVWKELWKKVINGIMRLFLSPASASVQRVIERDGKLEAAMS